MKIIFWFIVIFIIGWLIWNIFRTKKAIRAHDLIDEIKPWFEFNKINESELLFSSYEDQSYTRNDGATIIVGTSKTFDGNDIGFVLESIHGKGVVESEIIEPFGIATWHNSAAMESLAFGKPMIDVLLEMARIHREKHSLNED